MSVSLWPHGLYSQWNSPGQTTGVSSLSLLKGVFPTQGSNSGHPCCKCILYQLSYQGSSKVNMIIYFLMLKAFQVLYIPFMCYLSFLFMHLKLTISLLQGFLDSWIGKKFTCNVGDLGWEDLLKKGKPTNSNILAWVAKSQTGLSDFHFQLSPAWFILVSKNVSVSEKR